MTEYEEWRAEKLKDPEIRAEYEALPSEMVEIHQVYRVQSRDGRSVIYCRDCDLLVEKDKLLNTIWHRPGNTEAHHVGGNCGLAIGVSGGTDD